MALDSSSVVEKKRILLYPEKSPFVSTYWREKYEKDAFKYWNLFYKRNGNRFFKDRHYLDKEWGQYFHETVDVSGQAQTILEVGCGTGNTVYPLLSKYPQSYVYACDFSSKAVELVKVHEDYDESRIKAFVCDITKDLLSESIPPRSVDVVTMVFVLSAITPEKMHAVVCNLKSVLKPGGHILLRDYAVGDLAQERLMIKDQQISANFYVRGDGTRAYYFSEDDLRSLFVEEGFECKEMQVHCRQLENRSRKLVMDRRWIQAAFFLPGHHLSSVSPCPLPSVQSLLFPTLCDMSITNDLAFDKSLETVGMDEKPNLNREGETIVDLSEGCAAELFGGSPSLECLEIPVGRYFLHAKCLPRENQHTFGATGFMLWESAAAFGELLAVNPSVTKDKTVLELGCGSVGLCSLVTSLCAEKVVATDGDADTINLLQYNLHLNKVQFAPDKISCHKLKWGNEQGIDAVKEAGGVSGFQLIIGTDVTYVQEAVPLLFETARALLLEPAKGEPEPLLILCHRIRRVAESDIVASALCHGFSVTGLWSSKISLSTMSDELERTQRAYVECLFENGLEEMGLNYNSLQILCLSPKRT